MDYEYVRKNYFKEADAAERRRMFDYAEGYKSFLFTSKTERGACATAVKLCEERGYRPYMFGDKVKAGDKLSEEDKRTVEDAVASAKTELESGDNDRIKAASETLTQKIQPVIAKIYQQAQGAAGNNDGNGGGDDGTEFSQHS